MKTESRTESVWAEVSVETRGLARGQSCDQVTGASIASTGPSLSMVKGSRNAGPDALSMLGCPVRAQVQSLSSEKAPGAAGGKARDALNFWSD